jgi:hypothetical protein
MIGKLNNFKVFVTMEAKGPKQDSQNRLTVALKTIILTPKLLSCFIYLSNLLALIVPGEDFSRNAS